MRRIKDVFIRKKEAKIKTNLGSSSSVFFSKCLIYYPLTFYSPVKYSPLQGRAHGQTDIPDTGLFLVHPFSFFSVEADEKIEAGTGRYEYKGIINLFAYTKCDEIILLLKVELKVCLFFLLLRNILSFMHNLNK